MMKHAIRSVAGLTVALVLSGCASAHRAGQTEHGGADHASHDAQAAPAASAHDASAHAGHGTGTPSRAAEIAFLFADGDDKGWSKVENGMGDHAVAPEVPLALLPPATRVELLRQLALTLDVVKRYPTVKDAEAAGYRRAGPFIPGLGTHYVGGRTSRTGRLSDEDILQPSTIIYDGLRPDSPIAGLMYVAVSMGSQGTPEGFAGPNDQWHYHVGVCLMPGARGVQEALGFDGSITEADCRARGGNYQPITQHMLHVWTVPGYTSPLGIFSHANPAIRCPDGTYYTNTGDVTNHCRAR